EAPAAAPEPAAAEPRFHLVGHLQTNKARHGGAFDMIESVDSLRITAALERRLPDPTPVLLPMPVLLEVNVAGEASKHGFAPDEVGPALTAIAQLAKLDVVGLMTVAPLAAEAESVRPVFRELRRLRDAEADRLGPGHLSMGMSDDFQVAIAEGATMVRLGRAIFGDRRA
ncbi:MAG: YggS family pyridoxal phosphate-dependent enzyme, partial [Chloroflexota bacterium]|nr:YggS family pyridoxal phosphate-dependent enzyme [Chloroflexota bacterium]